MATITTGCENANLNRLYSRCEIPLENFVCPVVDLTTIVPRETQNNEDQPQWGCELWGVDHMSDADGQRVLATANSWSIEIREEGGDDSEQWPCGDDVDQMIVVDPAIAATYREGYLVCRSDQERVGKCPSLERRTSRRTCSKRGEMQTLGEGVAISSVVVTDDGPAVIWHEGDHLTRTPTVTWLTITPEGIAESMGSVEPCQDGHCVGNAREGCPLPLQSTAVGSAVVSPGLCGGASLIEVRRDGSTKLPVSFLPEKLRPEARGLALSPDGHGGYLYLWSNGPRLMATSLEEDNRELQLTGGDLGSHTEIWNPDRDDRGVASAACFNPAGREPRCMVSWVTPESPPSLDDDDLADDLLWAFRGMGGEVQWQLLSQEAEPTDAGVLGSGQHVQLAMSTEGTAERPLGIAVWREANYGILASAWRADTGNTAFGTTVHQLGDGRVDEQGGWSVSLPTILPIDRHRFIVGWWREQETLDQAELVTRIVHIDEQALSLSNTHLSLGEHDNVNDEIIKTFLPDAEGELMLDSFPPIMVWGRGPEGSPAAQGALLVVWQDVREQLLKTRTFYPSLPLPAPPDAVRFELSSDLMSFSPSDPSAVSVLIGGEAVMTREGVVIALDFTVGFEGEYANVIAVLPINWQGETPDGPTFLGQIYEGIDPFNITLWWRETSEPHSGELWLVYNFLAITGEEEQGFFFGMGGAILSQDEIGLLTIEHNQWLLPTEDQPWLWPIYPTFADGIDPMLVWGELDVGDYFRLLEDGSTGDPRCIEEHLRDAKLTFSLRMARVNKNIDTEELELEYLDVAVPYLSTQEPQYAFAAPAERLGENGLPVLDSETCVASAYSSLVTSDLYWGNDDEDVPQDAPVSGLAVGFFDNFDLPDRRSLEDDLFEQSWRIPTGVVRLDSAILSVASELVPYEPTSGTVRVFRSDVYSDCVVVNEQSAHWLAAVGGDELRRGRAVAMRLHTADNEGSAGAVWSWLVDGYKENESANDGERRMGADNFQIIFAEVDDTLRPASRAVIVDGQSRVPSIGFPVYESNEGGPTGVDVFLDAAHFNSAVAEVDEGEYVVVWVQYRRGTANDEPGGDLTHTGDVMAQLIVCE